MRIGELADTVGVNPKTVRCYETIGLLPKPARSAGGDRRITEMQPARGELAGQLQRAHDLPTHEACYCELIQHSSPT